jgi:predicted glycosyltransferase
MGGYNTVCEILSTSVPALIVPRTESRAEQRIRANSLATAGYLEQHEISTLTPEILADWLATRCGTTVDRRRAVLDGLIRVPQLAAWLLQPALAAGIVTDEAAASALEMPASEKGSAARVAV